MAGGWLGLDWGDVPAWIGTIVTSSSFAVAAVSYRRSVLDKERAQASSVAAWFGRRKGEDGRLQRYLLVSNGSDAPVYEVAVQVSGVRQAPWFDQVPAKTTYEWELPPGAQTGALAEPSRIAVKVWLIEAAAEAERVTGLLPEFEFRDATGRMWKRGSDGRLTRLRERTLTSSSVTSALLGGDRAIRWWVLEHGKAARPGAEGSEHAPEQSPPAL